jgi:hypothetical protein
MIIDLTEMVKKELSNFPQIPNNNPTSNASISKLFLKYSEDISNSLAKIRKILVEDRDNFFSNASYSYEAFTDRQREELTVLIRNNLAEVMNQINELKMFNDSDKTHKSQTYRMNLCRLK